MSPTTAPSGSRAWLLGLLGVTIFAGTLPLTRMAVGPADAAQLPPAFVTAGRAALAGVLAALWLRATRAPRPPRAQWADLAVSALGTVVCFPPGLALALRSVTAMHAAVVTGLLPLGTAAAAALWMRQRARPAFWACAVAGAALVVAFARAESGHGVQAADGWLLLSVAGASVGYVGGARAGRAMAAPQVISWVVAGSLPLTLAASAAFAPSLAQLAQVRLPAWIAFVYLGALSMWLGFFAWYRALALGGVMRISQIQLLQPFLALMMAWPLLGERPSLRAIGYALAMAVVVATGRRLSPVSPRPPATAPGDATAAHPGPSRN